MITLPVDTLSPELGGGLALNAILGQPLAIALWPLGRVGAPLTLASGGSDIQTLTAPADTQKIDSIAYGGDRYTLAVDPTAIQPGEFVYSSLTNQIQIRPRGSFQAGRSLLLQAPDLAAVELDYPLELGSLPDIFQRYELRGVIEWSCDWEGQPSGSFELLTDWATADALAAELIPLVTKLQLFGILFAVASLRIIKRSPLENPGREAAVVVSLRGGWESVLNEAVVIASENEDGTQPSGGRTIRGNTSVGAIAAKLGATALLPPAPIKAPTQRNDQTEITLQAAFEGHLRHNRCFARYSDADAIKAVRLDAVPIHAIAFTDIRNFPLEIAVNASPRAFDYANGRLEWGAEAIQTLTQEDVQGRAAKGLPPNWVQVAAKLETLVTGSPNLSPPDHIKDLIDTSFVFDNGGPTKEQTTTTTENGAITQQSYIKMGFVAVAHSDLYVQNAEGWAPRDASIIPALWKPIEQTKTTYFYDQDGWLGAMITTGWRLVRLQAENNNESLDAYKAWQNASAATAAKKLRILESYEFRQEPVVEQGIFYTDLFRQHYGDIPPRPTEEYEVLEPKFLSDGTLNPARYSGGKAGVIQETEVDGIPYLQIKREVDVPGFADPRFATFEGSRKSCFISAANPDSTTKKPLPPLTSGEDKETEKYIYAGDYRNSGNRLAEQFLTYERIQTQKEAGFARTAREVQETQSGGRPSEHARKETIYEKQDPAAGDTGGEPYEYIISTVPYDDPRITGETASYPYARTYDEAIAGLETDLEIFNTRDTQQMGLELRLGLGIREGDLLIVEEHGLWRVLGYTKSVTVLAPGVVQPNPASFDLGKRITVSGGQITVERKRIPQEPPANSSSTLDTFNTSGFTAIGATRGNAQGV